MPFRFESLRIWHQARELSNEVAQLVANFPEHERYGLASQMSRAANSISLNIAEGAGRDSNRDFSRFLGIAIGSTFEVVSASYLALDRDYIKAESHKKIYENAEHLAASMNAFRKTLNRS